MTRRLPRAAGPSALSNSTGYVVRRAYRSFTRALELRLTAHDITISMWFFLRLLWLNDGETQKGLSAELGLSQPTTVAAIDNLERRGFVERRRNAHDRRKTNVYLTPSGRALEAVLSPYVREVNDVALTTLKPQDLEVVRKLLLRILENLNRDIAAWPPAPPRVDPGF